MNRHIIHQKATVFQVKPPICKVTYRDISDALEVSRKMSTRDKRDYFYSNGIDYDNVEKYWDHVNYIERCMMRSSEHHLMRRFKTAFDALCLHIAILYHI